jgi:cobalt-zinc-cadmium efflux system protein
MISVAAVGLVANLVGMQLLRGASRGNLNVRAAFWHVVGDAASSVGVITAGILIWITGWYIADPIIAVLIACVILWGAAHLVIESVDILLEAVPRHIMVEDVVEAIKCVPGVDDVHDVHIWTVTSGLYALSAHVVIEDQTVSQSGDIVRTITDDLAGQFDIRHSTLQLECMDCPTGAICGVNRQT